MPLVAYERSADFGFLPLLSDWARLAQRKNISFDGSLWRSLWGLHFGNWGGIPDDNVLCTKFWIRGLPLCVWHRLNPSDILTLAEVLLRDNYEPMMRTLRRPVDTWVDIGAHVGLTTLYASVFHPRIRGVCVEPTPESATILRANLVASGLNVELVQKAVAATNGRARLYKTGWWSSCTTNPKVAEARLENGRRPEHTLRLPDILVEATTVENLLNSHNLDTVDLMKIDIEGTETEIFSVPQPWMRRVRRLCLDLHERYVDTARISQVLRDAGFNRVDAGRERLAVFDRGDG